MKIKAAYPYVFYCPRCGAYREDVPEAVPCPFCQTMMRIDDEFDIDFDEAYDAIGEKITLSELKPYIARKYISQNPEFDQALYEKRLQEEEEKGQTQRRISDEPRRCPRCGSSQLSVGSVGGWVMHPHLFCVKCGYDFGRLN